LVDEIVAAIAPMVKMRELRVGTQMSPVRRFAKRNAAIAITFVAFEHARMLGSHCSRRDFARFAACR